MSKTIVLIRHGQTIGNLAQVIQGSGDANTLTDLGCAQMEMLGQFMSARFNQVKLWHSTQKRVVEAVDIMCAFITPSEIVQTKDLMQRGWGSVVGESYDYRLVEAVYLGEPNKPLAYDAETLIAVRSRLLGFVDLLMNDTADTHMVVGSNELLNYLMDILLGRPFQKSSFLSGESLIIEMNGSGSVDHYYYYPQRMALMIGTTAMIDCYAKAILSRHRINVVSSEEVKEGNVVAVVLGDNHFGISEALEFPLLRTVARYGSGVNNVDVERLWQDRCISTTATSGISASEVAEFTLSQLIIGLRRAYCDCIGLKSISPKWRSGGSGLSLADSCIGVVGLGRIGLRVASLLKHFGSRVYVWNRTWPPLSSSPEELSGFERVDDLNTLCSLCDAVSVHLALTSDTRTIFNKKFFASIPSGKSIVFVNTARNQLVDNSALFEVINSNRVSYAAIDVWDPDDQNMSIIQASLRLHKNVFPTSHIAANTLSTRKKSALSCARSLVAAVEGRLSEIPATDLYPKS